MFLVWAICLAFRCVSLLEYLHLSWNIPGSFQQWVPVWMEILVASPHHSELGLSALLQASEQPFLIAVLDSSQLIHLIFPSLLDSASFPWFTLCLSPLEHHILLRGRFGLSIPRAIPYEQYVFQTVHIAIQMSIVSFFCCKGYHI